MKLPDYVSVAGFLLILGGLWLVHPGWMVAFAGALILLLSIYLQRLAAAKPPPVKSREKQA